MILISPVILGKHIPTIDSKFGWHELNNMDFKAAVPSYIYDASGFLNNSMSSKDRKIISNVLILPPSRANAYSWGYGSPADLTTQLIETGTMNLPFGLGINAPKDFEMNISKIYSDLELIMTSKNYFTIENLPKDYESLSKLAEWSRNNYIQTVISNSNDDNLRAAIAKNKNINLSTANKLLNDKNEIVLFNLANNPSKNINISQLFYHKNEVIRNAALRNPSNSISIQERSRTQNLLGDPYSYEKLLSSFKCALNYYNIGYILVRNDFRTDVSDSELNIKYPVLRSIPLNLSKQKIKEIEFFDYYSEGRWQILKNGNFSAFAFTSKEIVNNNCEENQKINPSLRNLNYDLILPSVQKYELEKSSNNEPQYITIKNISSLGWQAFQFKPNCDYKLSKYCLISISKLSAIDNHFLTWKLNSDSLVKTPIIWVIYYPTIVFHLLIGSAVVFFLIVFLREKQRRNKK
jgi:hypothetical protein